MLVDSHRYAMLLSALPYHGPLFGAKQTPLSRIRLQQKLAQLDPQDATDLELLGSVLDWRNQDMALDDARTMSRTKERLNDIANPFLLELIIWRLELRTFIAALRRRRRDLPPPEDNDWGYGRWLGKIRSNWTETAFGLEGAFPWLPEAARLIATGDALGLERLILQSVWTHLERLSDGHHFDFEAVVIYVMRWDLIARWTSYQGDDGLSRFETLVGEAMAGVDLDRAWHQDR